MVPAEISNEDFQHLLASRSRALLRVSSFLEAHGHSHRILTRPLVGELLFQSTQLEELLDAYGARNNSRWERFRSLTAAIKLFSYVSYELLHIQHSIPAYRLLDIGEDFVQRTAETIAFTEAILVEATCRLLEEARTRGLPVHAVDLPEEYYSERLPPGRLPHDLDLRKLETVSKTITLLATSFLNLSAECKQALPKEQAAVDSILCEYIGPVSEDKLRSFELRFHNLQSLYDTYVSTTETERIDPEIPVLRGHISVVLHLLRTARDFAHYIERHAGPYHVHLPPGRKRLVEPEILLDVMLNYSIHFVVQYLTCAENLCRNMLGRYTEITTIEVPVPPYRGFHVRPSTLIANIVMHYGSQVTMELDGKTYDAKMPLDLFRANEEINAHKRLDIATTLLGMNLVPESIEGQDVRAFVRSVLMTLSEHNKLILYEKPLQIETPSARAGAPLLKQITDEIARLQVTGKIDIVTQTKVRFIGDKRVLEDIRLLAEHGYGEDLFGNNIPLPDGLQYLRR
jgi:phosphotransferase system HPr-like phosphotransfer protein